MGGAGLIHDDGLPEAIADAIIGARALSAHVGARSADPVLTTWGVRASRNPNARSWKPIDGSPRSPAVY